MEKGKWEVIGLQGCPYYSTSFCALTPPLGGTPVAASSATFGEGTSKGCQKETNTN